MFCVKCGCELHEGDIFCAECGTRVGSGRNAADTGITENDSLVVPVQDHGTVESGKKSRVWITAGAVVACFFMLLAVVLGVVLKKNVEDAEAEKRAERRAEERTSQMEAQTGEGTAESINTETSDTGIVVVDNAVAEDPDVENSSEYEGGERLGLSGGVAGNEDLEAEAEGLIWNGEYLVFGHYEQDGDESNGAEPIEWVVLEQDGDRMLVVSRYILDMYCYHSDRDSTMVRWEQCDLRKWLNDDFCNSAFSDRQQSRILSTIVTNPDNDCLHTDGGEDTMDKLFCLSVEEVIRYYHVPDTGNGMYRQEECGELITEPTDMVKNRYQEYGDGWDLSERMVLSEEMHGVPSIEWWLRSPGDSDEHCDACSVSSGGIVGWEWQYPADYVFGVRPAMYISLE